MNRAKYAILEGIEQTILALRDAVYQLCRYAWMRPVASPLHDWLDALYRWYWENVL